MALARGWIGAAQTGVLALAALMFAVLGMGLSLQHPLSPSAVACGFWLALLVSVHKPGAWQFWLPALLPVLNFSPWTGWRLVDESDLLVLSVLAGGYTRWALALRAPGGPREWPGWQGRGGLAWLCFALAATGLWGAWRGWTSAQGGFPDPGALGDWLTQGLYADYDTEWNTLRVGKSLLWALLLLPLMSHAQAVGPGHGPRRLAHGMVVGLTLVCGLVLWERYQNTGLWDFNQPYRTSAWFWEMHVGGGAIDAYLAMAVPFAFWAVWVAPSTWRWLAANVLLWAAVYAVLTTYSRGVYLALLISLGFMGATVWSLKWLPAAGPRWRGRAVLAMVLALMVESAVVLGSGVFMSDRLSHADDDLVGRRAHWSAGLGLVSTGSERLLGVGLGRLPAAYNEKAPRGEFSGRAVWTRDDQGRGKVLLSGPKTIGFLAPYFGLTQRVSLEPHGSYRARLQVASATPGTLQVSLCERHLLYSLRCQVQWVALGSDVTGERSLDILLAGPAFEFKGSADVGSEGVLSLSASQSVSPVQLMKVELFGPSGRQVLQNADFSAQLQHWLPAAQAYFLPWHIDNLYLEVLIERGVLGLVLLVWTAVWAVFNLRPALSRRDAGAWVLFASLLGMAALGLVISVQEVPRVALILWLLVWSTRSCSGQNRDAYSCNRL